MLASVSLERGAILLVMSGMDGGRISEPMRSTGRPV